MEITEVKQHIKNKTLQPMYIFAGEELGIMDIYIRKIAEAIDTTPIVADSVASVIQRISNQSFVVKRSCFVVIEDNDFMKDETALENFMSGKIQKDNILIAVSYSLDKRSKLYKQYKTSIVEFNALPEANLKRYLAQKINLSDKNASKLIEVCENSYSRMMLEVDKIQQFRLELDDETILSPDAIFEYLLADGTIYQPPKDAIFDFVDAVLKRNSTLAFDLLEQCYAIGENTMALLSVLYNNTKQVFQVQIYDGPDVADATGLSGWQIKCAKEKRNRYTDAELVRMMKLVRSVEKGIKTGEIEDRIAVPYILVSVM